MIGTTHALQDAFTTLERELLQERRDNARLRAELATALVKPLRDSASGSDLPQERTDSISAETGPAVAKSPQIEAGAIVESESGLTCSHLQTSMWVNDRAHCFECGMDIVTDYEGEFRRSPIGATDALGHDRDEAEARRARGGL